MEIVKASRTLSYGPNEQEFTEDLEAGTKKNPQVLCAQN